MVYGNFFTQSTTTGWINPKFYFQAVNTSSTLSFGFHSGPGGGDTTYLDDVSVVEQSNPSVELLQNPSFERSTVTWTDWNTWTTTACTSGGGSIVTSGCHTSSGSNCLFESCHNGLEYKGQTFSTIVGDIYVISFWLQQNGGATRCYVSIY